MNVTKTTPLDKQCNEIVTKLIELRKQANFSQQFIAEWLGVSRKKLSEFENGKFDFKLMKLYADKLSLTINIQYIIY